MSIVKAARIAAIKAEASDNKMPEGIHCCFCRMRHHPGLGVKIYLKPQHRDNSFRLQKLAAEHGLAPNVLFAFTMQKHPRYRSKAYAYITETVTEIWKERALREDWYQYDRKNSLHAYNRITVDADYLRQRLEPLGIVTADIDNSGNMGWMPDGRLVCIDFGNMMFYTDSPHGYLDDEYLKRWAKNNPGLKPKIPKWFDRFTDCAILR